MPRNDEPQRFGRYELLTEIGRGGMATLYLGRLLGIGGFAKLVAIKRILPHLAAEPQFIEMFLNEGRIAARLTHPNVCQVHELDEVDGELFLAMEYLEGISWAHMIERLPVRSDHVRIVASVLLQAGSGLAYAHALRAGDGTPTPVVHRDISPQNLFVTVTGTCKLLDFGVAKLLVKDHQTRSGLLKGKLGYMSPEQIRGEPLDPRADVFSLGVVLWEALAGRRLFARDNDYQSFKAILEERIPPLPDYGSDMERVVSRALHRDRDRRYPDAGAFVADLERACATRGGPIPNAALGDLVRELGRDALAQRTRLVDLASTITSRAPIANAPYEPSVTRSVVLRGQRPRRRNRRAWYAAAVLAVATSAGALAAIAWPKTEPAPAPRAALAPAPEQPADIAPDAAIAPPAELALPPVVDDIEMAPDRLDPSRPGTRRVRPKVDATEPGTYSVSSTPYATIYIDGKRIDQTPLFQISLPPGVHQVRAVLADGRERKFSIRIAAGQHFTSGTLTW